MENVFIWYMTDNKKGESNCRQIKKLGLSVNLIKPADFGEMTIMENSINLFILEVSSFTPQQIINKYLKHKKIQTCLKYVILKKNEITELCRKSPNIMQLEFISQPLKIREFLLLIEKVIIVEQYHVMMKYISRDSEERIEAYEGLMNINRKEVFDYEKEKESFEKIIRYEKNILREQERLNNAIRDFALVRQSEYFDLKKRIDAEENLSVLRFREIHDAKSTIEAQNSILDFSAGELSLAKRILEANENVAEMSRKEAMDLHNELSRLRELNSKQAAEIESLRRQIEGKNSR